MSNPDLQAFAVIAVAALFAFYFWRGLKDGRASFSPGISAHREESPIRYWIIQGLNGFFCVFSLAVGLSVLLGISN